MTKYCTQCGSEVTDTQKFCNKCGLRLAPTQPTEQAAQPYPPQGAGTGAAPFQQPSYQPPPSAQAPYPGGYSPQVPAQPNYGGQAQVGGLAPNLVGALCYVLTPITAIIFLVLDPYNKDRFVRFHAWQAIFFAICWVALRIALGILYFALPDFLVGMLSLAVGLGFFFGWLWLMYQAYQGKTEKLPVIGDLAAQQVR